MLIIYPFHSGDQDLALRNAYWIAKLGTVASHQVLIVHDKYADRQVAEEIEAAFKPVFRRTVRMPLREGAPGARGTNLLFRRAVRQVDQSQAGSFLWMNPDAIPLRRGWLDAIEAAVKMLPRGKPFLGCHVTNLGTPFMAAVGVYPQDAEAKASNLVMAEHNPFHLNAAPQVVPQMAVTDLIVDSHISPFASGEFLPGNAVLWHGSENCRDGSLIRALLDLNVAQPNILDALAIREVQPEQRANGQEKFSVPEKPITHDAMAQLAASRAGSDGIPSEEIDTNTQVPRVRPPVISPVAPPKVDPVIAAAFAGITAPTAGVSPATAVVETAVAGMSAAATLGATAMQLLQPVVPSPETKALVESLNARPNENREKIAEHYKDAEPYPLELLANKITVANVGMFTTALATFRDQNATNKGVVLAALRKVGFIIAGKHSARRTTSLPTNAE